MPFKQYVRAEIAAGLDETYQFEDWAAQAPGAAYYDVHLSVIDEHETCVPTLRRAVAGAGSRLLESGCGTGRWMAFFERLGLRTFGVDDSAAPLRIAKQHLPAMRVVQADALRAPFKSGSFDVVFSSYVAEHFEDGPVPLFREIHRLLRPGGLLILIVPYNNWFRRLITNRALQAFYLVSRLRGRAVAFTEFRFTRGEIARALAAGGFAVEHVEPDDFRLPWAKGLSLDLGPYVRPRDRAPGGWELNAFGLGLARLLTAISPWLSCAGILCVARAGAATADGDARGAVSPAR